MTVKTMFIPTGSKIVIPKQPVRGGVGGNPFIWVQLVDGSGQAVTGEIYLGRCVQGLFNFDASLATAVKALANVVVDDCANSPGPYISLDGALTFTKGLQARFIFRNNDNPVGGPHVTTVMSDGIVLIPTGVSVTFPKQPVQGGVGGNPWISAQWRNGDGSPIGEEVLLGRCEQLSKN